MRGLARDGRACGILFGPERTGSSTTTSRSPTRCITVPLNPAFSSLNLAPGGAADRL